MSKTTTTPTTDYISSGGIINTSADTVGSNMDRLVEDGKITLEDKHIVLWLFSDSRDKGYSLADIGRQIGYSSTTISRLFGARYEGNYIEVIAKIRAFKRLEDERSRLTRDEFIETSIWHTIRKTCDLALIHQIPAMITGVPQIGKSEALMQYRSRSEYIVRYVRMPAAPGFRGAIEAIADGCSVTTRCTTEDLRRRLFKSLDSRSLLIIDELHQLAISAGRNAAMKIMEYIRELMDVSRCGLVVCGTKAIDEDLMNGDLKGWLEQFRERIINQVDLPSHLPYEDILLVAATFGLEEPDDDAEQLLKGIRFNRLLKTLALSKNLAYNRQQPLAWEHFNQVFKTINPIKRR